MGLPGTPGAGVTGRGGGSRIGTMGRHRVTKRVHRFEAFGRRLAVAAGALTLAAACRSGAARSDAASSGASRDTPASPHAPQPALPPIPPGFVETAFGGEGLAEIGESALTLAQGVPLSGVTYTGTPPKPPYTLEVEFTKLLGNDFPCAVTFPVAGSHLSLVLGGWGGTVCGLSSLDGLDAARNATRFVRAFPVGQRTSVRLEVEPTAVRAWVDGERVVEVDLVGRWVAVREELLPSRPLGLAAFATAVEFHAVRWRAGEPDAADRASEAPPERP